MPQRALLVFLVIALTSSSLSAQKVGDRIVVAREADTKVYDDKVDKVYGGSIHEVTQVNGTWIALDGVKGWLHSQYALSLDKAMQVYTQRVRANRNDFEALATRGMVYLEMGDPNRAFADLDAALKLKPKHATLWNNRGKVLMAQDKITLAIKDLSYAISLSPKFDAAMVNRGLCYLALGDYKNAVGDFNNAIQLSPRDPWHYIKRGTALNGSGQAEQALQDFSRALELRKNFPEAFLGKSNSYLELGQLDEAEKNASEAIRLSPKSAEGYNNRGWVYYKQRDFEKSHADFQKALQLDGQFATAMNNRAVVYMAEKKFDEAVADLNRAIKIDPAYALALTNRGNARMATGQYGAAAQDFSTAAKVAPKLPDVINGLGWFLATCSEAEFRDPKQAVEVATQACELTEWTDANCLDTLAAAFAESDDFENAIKWEKEAIKLAKTADDKESFQSRLALYEDRQPYRSETGKGQ